MEPQPWMLHHLLVQMWVTAIYSWKILGWMRFSPLLPQGGPYKLQEPCVPCAPVCFNALARAYSRYTRHEVSVSLWELIWGVNTRRYTLVHGFCFLKLFSWALKSHYCCFPNDLLLNQDPGAYQNGQVLNWFTAAFTMGYMYYITIPIKNLVVLLVIACLKIIR